jgi:transposase
MRTIGLDVHRDFCTVAISEGGPARPAGRVASTPKALAEFAAGLGDEDRVVLEATGNAWAMAAILESHVGEVVLAHPRRLRAIAEAKVKTDVCDARVLAELGAADLIPRVWRADEQTLALRRLCARRRQLVRQRTRTKNEAHSLLLRNLVRVPLSDLFGPSGRRWLAGIELPVDEQMTLDSCLRRVDFLADELGQVERLLAHHALGSSDIRRLMTIPGVDLIVATTLVGAIGDVRRFPSARHLVGYLGLHPRVRQSGSAAARHGRTSKEGSAAARHALVEAAWMASRAPGPLRAFALRVRARRGPHIAAVALARKLCALSWHLLSRQEDYAFARPSLVDSKLRRLELVTGTGRPRFARAPSGEDSRAARRRRERELAEQAERAYQRMVADWQAGGPRSAGAAPGRASSGQPEGDTPRVRV